MFKAGDNIGGFTVVAKIAGSPPFRAQDEFTLMEDIRNCKYTDIQEAKSEVPDEVAQIVRKMLDSGETADYRNCR
jgi:hypothetical protein